LGVEGKKKGNFHVTEIKICGITNIEDGLAAASAGADAVGFIFHPASPRYVTPGKAREIIGALPHTVCTVGVFVNLAAGEVLHVAELCGVDFIQLHGSETREYCSRFPRERLIKALSFRSEDELVRMTDYPVKAFLVDAHDPVRHGGTGMTCDWNLAGRAAVRHPLILAGGLHADNMQAALEAVRPLAVDVNSGVESAPRKKDHEKMRSVIAAVRKCDLSLAAETKKVIFRKLR
jgi:phosphoribosylanthranilate isomerase